MIKTISYTIFVTCLSAFPLLADDLAPAQGEVLLTVSGGIAQTNEAGTAQLDLGLLKAMGSTSFETSTIWTEGTQVFEGVSLAALVQELGLTGETLRATAINDYAVDIPMSDAVEGGPIVAYLLNGEEMSVRDKGPLWIVYPYDANADFRTEVIFSRSIWQLDRIAAVE